MSFTKLHETRQNSFLYKGKIYTAVGNFGFNGWSTPFAHAWKDNIVNDTPPGYTYEDFIKIAYENDAKAEIYECEGRLLIPYNVFIAEYRDNMHDLEGNSMS